MVAICGCRGCVGIVENCGMVLVTVLMEKMVCGVTVEVLVAAIVVVKMRGQM